MGVVLAWLLAVLVRSLTPVPMSVPVIGGGGGRGAVGGGGPVLRHLPGAAGGQARPDRRPEDGEMTLAALATGIALALATIREHKMRSFLTVLGVIIGTGAVIGGGRHHRRPRCHDHQPAWPASAPTASSSARRPPWAPGHPRGTPPQAADPGERPRHRRNAAPRCSTSAPICCPATASTPPVTRATTCMASSMAGTEEAYAAMGGTYHEYGRFFTDQENLHHMPRGGDRRGRRPPAHAQRGPHRQAHPGGWPRVSDRRA